MSMAHRQQQQQCLQSATDICARHTQSLTVISEYIMRNICLSLGQHQQGEGAAGGGGGAATIATVLAKSIHLQNYIFGMICGKCRHNVGDDTNKL